MKIMLGKNDSDFVDSARTRLTRGKWMSIIYLLIAAGMGLCMYYGSQMIPEVLDRQMRTKIALESRHVRLGIAVGVPLGFCLAVSAWALWCAVFALAGSKSDKLLVKYYEKCQSDESGEG